MPARRLAAIGIAALVGTLAGAAPAAAWTVADPDYDAQDYATGFLSSAGRGPTGVTVAPDHSGYVADRWDGFIYRLPHTGGGIASPSNRVNSTPFDHPADIQFTADHRLYVTEQGAADDVVEVDPADGSVVRTVASSLQTPAGLAQDPVSGDLFVSELDGGRVDRISHLDSATPIVTPYATGVDSPGGLAFGPDGTLYVAEATGTGASVWGIDGTATATPGAKPLELPFADGTTPDGVGVGDGFLMVAQGDGRVVRVGLTGPHTHTDVITGGTGGELGKVGVHGCFYATQSDRVLRILDHGGTCSMYPAVRYDEAPVATTGAAGGISGLRATLSGVVNPNGPATSVRFEYGRTEGYGRVTPASALDRSTSDHPVRSAVTHLRPRTTYHYRVVALNAQGTSLGADRTFTTRRGCLLRPRSGWVRKRRVRLTVLCDHSGGAAARGRLRIRRRGKTRTAKARVVSVRLSAGVRRRLAIKLPRRVVRALHRGRHVSATFRLVETTPDGTLRAAAHLHRLRIHLLRI